MTRAPDHTAGALVACTQAEAHKALQGLRDSPLGDADTATARQAKAAQMVRGHAAARLKVAMRGLVKDMDAVTDEIFQTRRLVAKVRGEAEPVDDRATAGKPPGGAAGEP